MLFISIHYNIVYKIKIWVCKYKKYMFTSPTLATQLSDKFPWAFPNPVPGGAFYFCFPGSGFPIGPQEFYN